MELIHKSTNLKVGEVILYKNRRKGSKTFKCAVMEIATIRPFKDKVYLIGRWLDGDLLDCRAGSGDVCMVYVKFRHRQNAYAYRLSPSEAAIYLL
jgi:hypothetical protein